MSAPAAIVIVPIDPGGVHRNPPGGILVTMLDDEWVATGPHQFVDCWCGHAEPNPLNGKTLDVRLERVHRWVTLGCGEDCELQSRVHGHVHIHCPLCAAARSEGTCCTPAMSE